MTTNQSTHEKQEQDKHFITNENKNKQLKLRVRRTKNIKNAWVVSQEALVLCH